MGDFGAPAPGTSWSPPVPDPMAVAGGARQETHRWLLSADATRESLAELLAFSTCAALAAMWKDWMRAAETIPRVKSALDRFLNVGTLADRSGGGGREYRRRPGAMAPGLDLDEECAGAVVEGLEQSGLTFDDRRTVCRFLRQEFRLALFAAAPRDSSDGGRDG